MKYRCIVIEDEPLAAKKIERFIEKHPDLLHIQSFSNPIDAIELLNTNDIDLVFLDIQMDQVSGIEFLKNYKLQAKVIITTAFSDYALEGYELNVSDYLLKPFSFSRFLKAIEAVKSEFVNQSEQEYIFVKTDYHLEKIIIKDIKFIKGMRDYLLVVTTDKKVMTLDKFSTYENQLPKSKFTRIHKSYLVSLSKIDRIEKGCIYIDNEAIPIGETYRASFIKKIRH